MKHYLIIFIICGFAINSCSQESKKKIATPFKSNDLYGVWANSNFKKNRDFIISAVELFPPISGFSISFDSLASKNSIFIQYGEQSAKWLFDTLYYDHGTIWGRLKDSIVNICLYNKDQNEISYFQLIDYGVYGSGIKPDMPINFYKISDCIVENSLEAFILDEVFDIFPITVLYNSKDYHITSTRKKCLSYGEISGLDGYSDYEINNVFNRNGQSIYSLAFFNVKEDKFDFFELTLGDKNILRKVR